MEQIHEQGRPERARGVRYHVISARALGDAWGWHALLDEREEETPVFLRRPGAGNARAAARLPTEAVLAYEEGSLTAYDLVSQDMLREEFRVIAGDRLPIPASPALMEKYVEFCCEAAALACLRNARHALDRVGKDAMKGMIGCPLPSLEDCVTIQEAMAASRAAREMGASCKRAICAALTERRGTDIDLVDTIARAARRQAEWQLLAGEPGNDLLAPKFLEEQFDGTRPAPPDYPRFDLAGDAWRTDRELEWAERPELEESHWRRVAEAQRSGEEEPCLASADALAAASRAAREEA